MRKNQVTTPTRSGITAPSPQTGRRGPEWHYKQLQIQGREPQREPTNNQSKESKQEPGDTNKTPAWSQQAWGGGGGRNGQRGTPAGEGNANANAHHQNPGRNRRQNADSRNKPEKKRPTPRRDQGATEQGQPRGMNASATGGGHNTNGAAPEPQTVGGEAGQTATSRRSPRKEPHHSLGRRAGTQQQGERARTANHTTEEASGATNINHERRDAIESEKPPEAAPKEREQNNAHSNPPGTDQHQNPTSRSRMKSHRAFTLPKHQVRDQGRRAGEGRRLQHPSRWTGTSNPHPEATQAWVPDIREAKANQECGVKPSPLQRRDLTG